MQIPISIPTFKMQASDMQYSKDFLDFGTKKGHAPRLNLPYAIKEVATFLESLAPIIPRAGRFGFAETRPRIRVKIRENML